MVCLVGSHTVGKSSQLTTRFPFMERNPALPHAPPAPDKAQGEPPFPWCFRARNASEQYTHGLRLQLGPQLNSVATSTISSYGTPKRCNVSIFMLFSRTLRATVSSFSAHRCLAVSNCFFVSSFESYEKSGGSCRTNSGNSKTWKRIKLELFRSASRTAYINAFSAFLEKSVGTRRDLFKI